ncbi:Peptidase inhibitor I9 [Tenacibaculum sp. MAR_2009_124]|uniref:S8 family serine peptidase n=1 Tax=Tenacibaculum sp. MAR_2009_124 TaxID=1250059 RepID=UPI00089CC90B|nr:S8 family serine peptidase [Tenacibaculum sp. MAR_2009_124]SEB85622.1 Peptidase inhibitor I9 [Tenacibaculum sp. MAR_2009_124]
MKNVTKFIFCATLMALVMTSCQNENSSQDNLQSDITTAIDDKNIIPGQYIVVFKESKIASAAKQLGKSVFTDRKSKAASVDRITETSIKQINAILADNNVDRSKVLNYYTTKISGMAIKLSDAEFDKIAKDENVESIEFDRRVELPKFEVENVTTLGDAQRAPQTTPCGINNAGGFANGASKNTWVWVIDSGIDLDHPDLNVVTSSTYAKSFVGGSANDCNGHGTHVAGTAAAKNNSVGVVGVSAGASVVPVRVFGCSGGSSTSTILAGINHVGRYDIAGDVANLSLGGYHGSGCSSSSSYRSALNALSNGGTYVSIAAGNSSANAALYDPACINGSRIYTVASMTCSRGFSSFSNYNMNPVDFIATGSSVYSTYLNGGYATLSGTSMAAPHVAGIMHARGSGPRSSGSVFNRGESYPIAVR